MRTRPSEIKNIFYLDLHGHKRWLRPDMITKPIVENEFNANPLDIAESKRILTIKKSEIKSLLSFGISNINVEISFNHGFKEFNNSNIMQVSEQIFNLFSDKFSNLYRTKGIQLGSLPGFQYLPKNRYSFSLKNIPKKKFDEVYQDIHSRWKGNKEINEVFIVDWKYHSNSIFNKPNYRSDSRINESIIKSLAYEFCLSTIISEPIHSQFAIPYYDIKTEDIIIGSEKIDCNIELVRMNFLKIQEIYLND